MPCSEYNGTRGIVRVIFDLDRTANNNGMRIRIDPGGQRASKGRTAQERSDLHIDSIANQRRNSRANCIAMEYKPRSISAVLHQHIALLLVLFQFHAHKFGQIIIVAAWITASGRQRSSSRSSQNFIMPCPLRLFSGAQIIACVALGNNFHSLTFGIILNLHYIANAWAMVGIEMLFNIGPEELSIASTYFQNNLEKLAWFGRSVTPCLDVIQLNEQHFRLSFFKMFSKH